MAKKLTTTSFIERSKSLYVNLDYSKVVYTNKYTHVVLICNEHNHEYRQRPCDHYKAKGCKFCVNSSKKVSFKEWLIRSLLNNENFNYDLSSVVEENFTINDIISVRCARHGFYDCKASSFMIGRSNCLKCVGKYKKSVPEIVSECNEKFGNQFDYSNITTIVNNRTKVPIVCKDHGLFYQGIYDHLNSQYGCKMCADNCKGWSRSKWVASTKGRNCCFYIIMCHSDFEVFYKVGITSLSIAERYKTRLSMPYHYDIIVESFDEPEKIWDLEKAVMRSLSMYKYQPLIEFRGSKTECFNCLGGVLNEFNF